MVSYLSLAHGGDRGICWQAMFAGAKIGFARTISHSHHDSNDIPSIIISSSGGGSSSSDSSIGGGSSRAVSSAVVIDAVSMLLEDIQAICPTFFLGMPHFWSECHVLYTKELEILVTDIVLTLLLNRESNTNNTTSTPHPSVLTRLLQESNSGNEHGWSLNHLPSNPETCNIVLAALRQLDGYHDFVDAIGTLYGVTKESYHIP